MKKQFFLFAFIIAAVLFSSCKKEYECECKDTITGEIFVTTTIETRNKPLARTACSASDNYVADIKCTLK